MKIKATTNHIFPEESVKEGMHDKSVCLKKQQSRSKFGVLSPKAKQQNDSEHEGVANRHLYKLFDLLPKSQQIQSPDYLENQYPESS